VETVIENNLDKKENVDEKYIPHISIYQNRVATPLCDIYYFLQRNELAKTKEVFQKENKMENFWVTLFGKVAEENKFNQKGEQLKSISNSSGEFFIIEELSDSLSKNENYEINLSFLENDVENVRLKKINKIMSEKNNQLALFSFITQKRDLKDLKLIVNNEFLNNKFPWIKEWKNKFIETPEEIKYHKFSFMIYDKNNEESIIYFEMKENFDNLVKEPNSNEKKTKIHRILPENWCK